MTSSRPSQKHPDPLGKSYGVKHLVSHSESSLREFVAHVTSVAPGRALELIELGSVYVNDVRRLDPESRIDADTKIRVHTEPRRFRKPQNLSALIQSETADWLIIDKPAGLPVHALVDNAVENLLNYLEVERGEKLFITHRLDVDTCGLVLIARNLEAQRIFNQKFATHEITRRYVALTEVAVTPGTHVGFMEPSPRAPKTMSLTAQDDWQRCETHVLSCNPLSTTGDFVEVENSRAQRRAWHFSTRNESPQLDASQLNLVYKLEVELVTGRTQQIRAHMALLGAPLLGDEIYGSKQVLTDPETHVRAIGLWAHDLVGGFGLVEASRNRR